MHYDQNVDTKILKLGEAKISSPALNRPGGAKMQGFVGDDEGVTEPVDCKGFGTPTKWASASDTWQTVTWDLPWPPCFDRTGIDEIKFVVNDTDEHKTGTLYVDNISLISDPLPPPVTGLAYVFEDFNDRDEWFNDFSGNWGVLISDSVTISFDSTVFAGAEGASLKVEYDLPAESYAGLWHSLWGHSDYTRRKPWISPTSMGS